MLTLEKPDLDDTSQLAATTIEALNELLAASAPPPPTPPAVAVPAPVSTWVELGVTPQVLAAASIWCAPTVSWDELLGCKSEPGTGEPDTAPSFPVTTTATPHNVALLLDSAADRIERFGWVQGTLRSGERTCLVGAIGSRLGATHPAEPGIHHRTAFLYRRAYEEMTRHLGMEPERWNDAVSRTAADVTAALRKCAANLRQRPPLAKWREVPAWRYRPF